MKLVTVKFKIDEDTARLARIIAGAMGAGSISDMAGNFFIEGVKQSAEILSEEKQDEVLQDD